MLHDENDIPKRQKIDNLSDTSSYESADIFAAMLGDFSQTHFLFKSVCQQFWNNGKESKIAQEIVFINERMAVLYCLKLQMQKESCEHVAAAMGGLSNDWILMDTEYLKMCLEEMNTICERERFGTCYRVEREISISVCSPSKLYSFLTAGL